MKWYTSTPNGKFPFPPENTEVDQQKKQDKTSYCEQSSPGTFSLCRPRLFSFTLRLGVGRWTRKKSLKCGLRRGNLSVCKLKIFLPYSEIDECRQTLIDMASTNKTYFMRVIQGLWNYLMNLYLEVHMSTPQL